MKLDDNFMAKVLSEMGLSFADSLPLTEEEQQSLYATAYTLYEQGLYDNATKLFTQLVLYNPYIDWYWRGLAACKQMNGEYTAALHAWALVALLKDKDPMPHFHAAECYASLNEKGEARKALDAALSLLNQSKEHEQLRQKIELLKGTL